MFLVIFRKMMHTNLISKNSILTASKCLKQHMCRAAAGPVRKFIWLFPRAQRALQHDSDVLTEAESCQTTTTGLWVHMEKKKTFQSSDFTRTRSAELIFPYRSKKTIWQLSVDAQLLLSHSSVSVGGALQSVTEKDWAAMILLFHHIKYGRKKD